MDGLDATIFSGFLRVFIGLMILTPAIYGVTRWYASRGLKNSTIRVRESVQLGGSRGSLYVVEWEGELLLLGVTNNQITVVQQKPKGLPVEQGDET